MKPEIYAHAILHMIKKGETPREAITRMHKALEAKGRVGLMPHIARAFRRLALKDANKSRSLLTVARVKDEQAAREASGARDAELAVDPTLIGGWTFEDKGTLTDASWKSSLLSIYRAATRT
ncbi:MAG: F0F1 ATP synthase subunit delta [Patescibacteria group bacterium]